ncbi:MAG: 6,7-dimethyl-8-ribityllumazine synthase [Myxococcales bacterium]|nr:6,7-dimethyl-8-ribityllumazine synthase [Myxococcales bacterium]
MPHHNVKTHAGQISAAGKRFALIASRFNDFMVDKLVEGAIDGLLRTGAREADIELYRCPGAFEIAGLARRAADSGRFDAIVCLGVVIRGATPHFDLVVGQATAAVAAIAAEGKVAVGNGIVACETMEQAIERAGSKAGNRGYDAALVAAEMAQLYATAFSQ